MKELEAQPQEEQAPKQPTPPPSTATTSTQTPTYNQFNFTTNKFSGSMLDRLDYMNQYHHANFSGLYENQSYLAQQMSFPPPPNAYPQHMYQPDLFT